MVCEEMGEAEPRMRHWSMSNASFSLEIQVISWELLSHALDNAPLSTSVWIMFLPL